MADVFDVVREANPIKDIDRYAEYVVGLDEQFHTITRRDRMIDDKPSLVELESTSPQRWRPRWRLAAGLAAFALVIVVGLGFALSSGGDDTEPADRPAPTTAPTTVPTSPTAAMPLETVETFLERWVAADAAGAMLLISPEATGRCYDCSDATIQPWADHNYSGIDIRTMAIAYISGDGVSYACTADESIVTCTLQFETLFATDESSSFEWVSHYTVADGLITFLDAGFYPDVAGIGARGIADYESWLAENHPSDYEELVFLGTILLNEPEQLEAHRAFVAEWRTNR